MEAFIIFNTLIVSITLIILLCSSFYEKEVGGVLLTVVLLLAEAIVFFDAVCYIHKPTAIDVYRNKTTLQITYKDSIPVDTMVVFKNE